MAMKSKWIGNWHDHAHFTELLTFAALVCDLQNSVASLSCDMPPDSIWLRANSVGNMSIIGEWADGQDVLGFIDLGQDVIVWADEYMPVSDTG